MTNEAGSGPRGAGSSSLLRAVVLTHRGDDDVEARELSDGGIVLAVSRLPRAQLAGYVRQREPAHPRWVWTDTTRWYPALLDAGVRVERCTDLRLCHHVLRRSPFVDQSVLAGDDVASWDGLDPLTVDEPALFPLDDPADQLDPVAEHGRQQAAVAAAPQRSRLGLLLAAESSGGLAAAEMTHTGLPWRADVHDRLLTELLGPRPAPGQRPATLERLLPAIRQAFGAPALNPDSPTELLLALRAAGLEVPDTRSWTLQRHADHPGIRPLLEYKKLLRLMQANGWNWLDSWVRAGRFRPSYLPGGVVTGRWASSGGGALSAPVQLRSAVIADEGWRFVVADVAQLEPRVLAALSTDSAMAEAAQTSDMYQAMVDSGAVATRSDAKLGMLGAMYGGTRGESGRMIARMTRRYPQAIGLVEEAARAGERGEVVHTLLGRGSPVPTGAWTQRSAEFDEGGADDADRARDTARDAERHRRAWGRFTRNFVVQGTGAEWALCWLAVLRNCLWGLAEEGPVTDRPHLVFFLHDEVVVHSPAQLADAVADAVRTAAAEAGRLLFGSFPVDFPLDVAVVGSWADADVEVHPAPG